METAHLKTEPRTETGSRAARKLRQAGRIPALLLGGGEETVLFSIPARDFETALRHRIGSFELEIDGVTHRAVMREVQWDRMGDEVQHVDFLRDPDGSLARRIETELEEAAAAAAAAK